MTKTASGLSPSSLKGRKRSTESVPDSVPVALAIPDPRTTPVPFGWAEATAMPAINGMREWGELSEAEAQLAAFVSFLEAHGVDTTEFLKALRMVEVRRAALLPRPGSGGAKSRARQFDDVNASPQTISRWRKLADNWEWLLPYVLAATKPNHVSQSRLLKMIDEHTPAAADGSNVVTGETDIVEPTCSLLFGEFQDRLASLDDGSVDLIITDPPYPVDQQELWSDLAKLAAVKLSPRGYLMAMSGKIHLDQVMVRLSEHLHYGWMFSWPLPGEATRILSRNIRQTWKPILVYTVGSFYKREPVQDTIPTSIGEKALDGWQQQAAPAQWLIERFTPPDGLVVDPFLGAGSFGVAARDAGRRFIGVEVRGDRFRVAAERLTS